MKSYLTFILSNPKPIYPRVTQDNINLTTAQINSLMYLANSCPFINAEAVFNARAMMRINDPHYYNNLLLCYQAVEDKEGNYLKKKIVKE
jgi:hypothetical protein